MRAGTRAIAMLAAVLASGASPIVGQDRDQRPLQEQGRPPTPTQTPQTPQTPQAVFRSTIDLVTIPVFVKGDAATVAALTAGDFVLTDNGVAQTVEMVASESLPVDVTVIVETGRALVDYADDVHEQVRRIAGLVRPGDRLEVLGVGDYVTVLVPFGSPDRAAALPRQPSEGLSAINDALIAALVREPDPDRRHLVIALTDSIDTMSTVDLDTVREVARQSNATLVVSWITLSVDDAQRPRPGEPPHWIASSEKVRRHIRGASQRTVPRRQTWTPHIAPPQPRTMFDFDALDEATELTGGGLYPPGIFVNRNASVIFDKVYADFRRNVVLRYRPEGVERVGWHDVTVTVPAHRGLEVRPRRGYLVEAEPPSGVGAALSEAALPPPGSLDALTTAANAATPDEVLATIDDVSADPERLAGLVAAFRDAGNLWPADPRREFVVALALAGAAAASASERVRLLGIDLLAGYESLVPSPLGPSDFERDWLAAEAAVLEAAMRPAEALPRIRAALARFPDDPRLRLARATLADQLTAVPLSSRGVTLDSPVVAQVLEYYDAVPADSGAFAEAAIRTSWLLRRLGRDADANRVLSRLGPLQPDGDPTLPAWRALTTTLPSNALVSDPAWQAYWQADFRRMRELVSALWPK